MDTYYQRGADKSSLAGGNRLFSDPAMPDPLNNALATYAPDARDQT
jgi:hypothetical protein